MVGYSLQENRVKSYDNIINTHFTYGIPVCTYLFGPHDIFRCVCKYIDITHSVPTQILSKSKMFKQGYDK